MSPLILEVEPSGDRAVLRLAGELDVVTSPELRDTIVRLISEGRTSIVLDCAKLAFVDSTGLGVFVGARARAKAANGNVSLCNVQPAMERLLAVTGMADLFERVPEPTAA
jgi:anti-sigma B factor antagonist